MNKKMWIFFVAIVIIVIGGMLYYSNKQRLDVSDIGKDGVSRILDAEDRNGNIADHIIGNKDAKVVVIEYSDFQCPGCKIAAPETKRVAEKYKQNIALVFRNFPITSIHPNARAAAAAAEAAGLQGKFWEMHDLLYANQTIWSGVQLKDRNDTFLGYAKQLGLDEDKFNKDSASQNVTKKIDFDIAIAHLRGVKATPSIYINGEEVKISNGPEDIDNAVKSALVKANVKIDDK